MPGRYNLFQKIRRLSWLTSYKKHNLQKAARAYLCYHGLVHQFQLHVLLQLPLGSTQIYSSYIINTRQFEVCYRCIKSLASHETLQLCGIPQQHKCYSSICLHFNRNLSHYCNNYGNSKFTYNWQYSNSGAVEESSLYDVVMLVNAKNSHILLYYI